MPDMMAYRNITSATPRASNYGRSVAPISSPSPKGFSRTDFSHHNDKKGDLVRLVSEALELVREDLDESGKVTAQRAISDALTVISSVEFTEMPWTGVSDEGIVTVQWQREGKGIAFFFSGDGVFDFSIKASAMDHYSTDHVAQKVENGIPSAFQSEILSLSQAEGSTIIA